MIDRSIAPSFSKAFSFELPNPEVVKLPSAVDMVYLQGLQQEVFKLEVIFNAGKWQEPKPGLAHFTSIMLDKGTSSRTSKEIAGVLDYYGAQIEISSGYDFVSISLYGLKKFVREILPIFIEILSDPSFAEEEFDLQKKIFLQNLEINEKKTSFLASRLIRKNIFGSNHPYGNSVEKTDVNTITRDDLKNYFASNFSPYEIYLVGNLESQEIHWLVEQFSSSRVGLSNVIKDFAISPGDPTQHVARPDSVQSSIRMGMRTINRGHKDYFSLLLLNHILGGYFGSRLMKNVREEKGLTYGIYSSLNPFKNDSMFSIGADVDKANVKLTIDEIKKEIETLCLNQINEEELEVSKNHLLGGIQLEMANPFSTFDKIKNVRLNQLEKDYYNNLFTSVKSIGPEMLQITAQKYFDINNLTVISVG
jgi:predicted Zn-dependent peptidase